MDGRGWVEYVGRGNSEGLGYSSLNCSSPLPIAWCQKGDLLRTESWEGRSEKEKPRGLGFHEFPTSAETAKPPRQNYGRAAGVDQIFVEGQILYGRTATLWKDSYSYYVWLLSACP